MSCRAAFVFALVACSCTKEPARDAAAERVTAAVVQVDAGGHCDDACRAAGCTWVEAVSHCYQHCTADWECKPNELCLCADGQRCLVPTVIDELGLTPRSDVCVQANPAMLKHRRAPAGTDGSVP